MRDIPKLIHQIWSDKYRPLPAFLRELAQTWTELYPDWSYILWDEKNMNDFIREQYPQYCEIYYKLPFDIQRWDAIRYLILYKMGGMHVDCDYECLENMDILLKNRACSIALEPDIHCEMYGVKQFLNSALLVTVPEHFFLRKIIERVFSEETLNYKQENRAMCVLNTTGPLMLSSVYESLSKEEKEDVFLIPAKYVTPFDSRQIEQVKNGVRNEELENCMKEAYAVHYFTNGWLTALV